MSICMCLYIFILAVSFLNMSYVIVEFSDHEIGVVYTKWFTPEKTQVYWPPYKDSFYFRKALGRGEEPNQNWPRYPIKKLLYETDNLEKALKKQQEAELTSNLSSDEEQSSHSAKKRTRQIPKKYISSSGSESEQIVKRPPRLDSAQLIQTANSQNLLRTPTTVALDTPSRTANSPNLLGTPSVVLETPSRTTNEVISSDKFDCILTHLVKIEQQNNQILALLRQQQTELVIGAIPDYINELPLKTIEELNNFETKLSSEDVFKSLVINLSQIGGNGTVTRTNKILRFLLRDDLASGYNFCGHNAKQPFFKLKLKDAIIQSVKHKEKLATTHDIEQCIKNWLKYAPKRLQISNKNKNKE